MMLVVGWTRTREEKEDIDNDNEDNEDMWYIGEYEIERSPTPQIPSPGPVVPQRPAEIRDILENHPDTE